MKGHDKKWYMRVLYEEITGLEKETTPELICTGFLKYPFGHLFQTEIKIDFKTNWIFFSSSNWNFTACVAYKNQVRTEMEFSYSQTENFEMGKSSSDTGYFKKPVEINRGFVTGKSSF